jgi:hypothetical protein
VIDPTPSKSASGASRYIISWGWAASCDVIEAANIYDAKAEASKRGMAEGLLDDDLSDTCWAEPYSDGKAHEYGLLPYEDTHSAMQCDPHAFAPAKGW